MNESASPEKTARLREARRRAYWAAVGRPEALIARIKELEAELAAVRAGHAATDAWPGVVYYVTWTGEPEGLIKIGFSRDLSQRLNGLRWRGRVPEALAAEPAPVPRAGVEARRKTQFAHLRVRGTGGPRMGRTELFRQAPELDEHMEGLRCAYPRWRGQCGLLDSAEMQERALAEADRIFDAAHAAKTRTGGEVASLRPVLCPLC